jgi:hypothetical protein
VFMFFLGFEKRAAIDFFHMNRNSYTDKVHSLLGPGYEKEHVQSYIKNLRPWEAGKNHEETATDVKRLYDKKEKYNKVQAGLLKTKEGSPEEAAYLKKNKGNLDKHIADWANDNADTMEKYKSPYATAGRAASKFYSGQFGKQAKESLIGGKADGKPTSDFPADQVAMGKKVEREHTNNPGIAEEIVADHLSEDKKYYSHLKEMEDKYVKTAFAIGFEKQAAMGFLAPLMAKATNFAQKAVTSTRQLGSKVNAMAPKTPGMMQTAVRQTGNFISKNPKSAMGIAGGTAALGGAAMMGGNKPQQPQG